jgi:uncharacterized protein (TIGR02271 family)
VLSATGCRSRAALTIIERVSRRVAGPSGNTCVTVRRPVTGTAGNRDVQISAQEFRVPLTEEEAVIEKRPVVKEEVIISKRPVEKRDSVEADVRKERIDVERHEDVRAHERDRDKTG